MALRIDAEIRDYLNDNLEVVDAEQWYELFKDASKYFTDRSLEQLTRVLEDCGADTAPARERLFVETLANVISSYLTYKDPQDTANSWSRLQYLLMETGHFAFDYTAIVQIIERHAFSHGWKLSLLPNHACYEMNGDINMGWMDLAEYTRLYNSGNFN